MLKLLRVVERFTGSPSMLWIAFTALFLYAVPLVGILLAAISSRGFTLETTTVYAAGFIAQDFMQTTRETFGSIIVPLLTAFALKNAGADEKVPGRTFAIFAVLAILFVVSSVSYGLVMSAREEIAQTDEKIASAFADVTRSYIKESLTYLALTLGISLKKS